MKGTQEIQEHVRSLHRFATGLVGNPTDAEDLVQECLRRVLDQLDRQANIRNFRAYLFQTLRNVHIDQCRQRNVRGEETPADGDGPDAISAPPNQEDRLRCADIADALERLPQSQREIVLLVCLDGMTYEEVAEITGTPIGTVRSRLHRGRAALHAMIDPASIAAKRTDGPARTRAMAVGETEHD